ncbi:bacteriocin-like protein [Chryseobacterium hagamense]|uniref:bacteriocin-like protein n=1 Tax=Chryseobacterium hagamense TaxID=395935 RepID=UPI0011BDFE85|nr:hypothetical protein [Chryseobacterium hagamense]
MKNFKKLSRRELLNITGSFVAPGSDLSAANDCHVHYKRNPDGSLGAIVSSGSGPCHPVSGTICRTFSSGTDGNCY